MNTWIWAIIGSILSGVITAACIRQDARRRGMTWSDFLDIMARASRYRR